MKIKALFDMTVIKEYTAGNIRRITDIKETDERFVRKGDVLKVFTEFPEYYIAELNGEAVVIGKTETEVCND